MDQEVFAQLFTLLRSESIDASVLEQGKHVLGD